MVESAVRLTLGKSFLTEHWIWSRPWVLYGFPRRAFGAIYQVSMLVPWPGILGGAWMAGFSKLVSIFDIFPMIL